MRCPEHECAGDGKDTVRDDAEPDVRDRRAECEQHETRGAARDHGARTVSEAARCATISILTSLGFGRFPVALH